MPTTSIDQKFYVSDENIDAFIETVTSAPSEDIFGKFESWLLRRKNLLDKVSSTND